MLKTKMASFLPLDGHDWWCCKGLFGWFVFAGFLCGWISDTFTTVCLVLWSSSLCPTCKSFQSDFLIIKVNQHEV